MKAGQVIKAMTKAEIAEAPAQVMAKTGMFEVPAQAAEIKENDEGWQSHQGDDPDWMAEEGDHLSATINMAPMKAMKAGKATKAMTKTGIAERDHLSATINVSPLRAMNAGKANEEMTKIEIAEVPPEAAEINMELTSRK